LGVGAALYFLQRQRQFETVEESPPDTAAIPESAQLAKMLISQEEASPTQGSEAPKPSESGGREITAKTREDTAKVAEVGEGEESVVQTQAQTTPQEKSGTTLEPNLTSQQVAAPSTPSTGSQITVPTIDLSSTIDLTTPNTRSTPKVPTVKPNVERKPPPSFSIDALSEDEIKKVYFQEGNIAKAERMLRKELKRNPKSTLAKKYLHLIKLERQALALEAQGDPEGAKRIWQQILRIAPDHPRAKKKVR